MINEGTTPPEGQLHSQDAVPAPPEDTTAHAEVTPTVAGAQLHDEAVVVHTTASVEDAHVDADIVPGPTDILTHTDALPAADHNADSAAPADPVLPHDDALAASGTESKDSSVLHSDESDAQRQFADMHVAHSNEFLAKSSIDAHQVPSDEGIFVQGVSHDATGDDVNDMNSLVEKGAGHIDTVSDPAESAKRKIAEAVSYDETTGIVSIDVLKLRGGTEQLNSVEPPAALKTEPLNEVLPVLDPSKMVDASNAPAKSALKDI